MSDSLMRATPRASLLHYAIADMWPDDHDAMLAELESGTPSSSGGHPDDQPRRNAAAATRESSITRLVRTAIADMWPDDDEAMNPSLTP